LAMNSETPGLRLAHSSTALRRRRRRNGEADSPAPSVPIELRLYDFRPDLFDSLLRTGRSRRLRRMRLTALWLVLALACLAIFASAA